MFKTLISAVKAMMSVIALVFAFSMNVSAQDRVGNGAQKMTDNMKAELSLSDDQYTKVLEINNGFTKKTVEARKASVDKKETAKVVKGFDQEREAKLKTVLTEEQFKTYLIKKEEKKKKLIKRMEDNSVPLKKQ